MDKDGHFHLCQQNPDTNRPTTIVSYCCGVNNDCTCLQSGTTCKGVICYCTNYSSKSPLKMQTTFDTIKAVITSNVLDIHKEEQTDSNVLGRKLLIKMCNMLTVKMEMGGPMVAHYLLGGNGYYTNINFCNLYWCNYVDHINVIESSYKTNNLFDEDSNHDEEEVNQDEIVEHVTSNIEVILDENDELVALPIVSIYTLRGECMDNINLFEFYSSYEVREFSNGETVYSYEKNYQDRPIRFLEDHVHYGIKAIFRTTERRIINLCGSKIPAHNTEDYYQLICILFVPWRSYRDLNPLCTSWEQVYHDKDLFQKHNIYLRHWNILNECYDEKDDIYKQRQMLQKSMGDEYDPSQDITEFISEFMEGDSVNAALASSALDQFHYKLGLVQIEDALNSIGYSKSVHHNDHLFQLEPVAFVNINTRKYWENTYKKNKLLQNSISINSTIRRHKNFSQNYITVINPITSSIDFHIVNNSEEIILQTIQKMSNLGQPLYDDQIRALTLLVKAHLSPGPKPLLMMLNGIAGSGKSTVLKAFKYALEFTQSENQILIMAFTGTAAANVGGVTFNSVFGSLTRNSNTDKIKLHQRLKNIKWLFYDEWSMISTRQLYRMSDILSDSLSNEKPFGGLNVVLAGDPAQLPPNYQNGKALYKGFNLKFATHKDAKTDDVKGHIIRKQFTIVVQLRKSMRTEAVWYKAINQARYSSCDADSIQTIKSVMLANPSHKVDITNPNFSFKSIITPRCKFRDQVNSIMSKKFDSTFNKSTTIFYSNDKLRQGTISKELQELLWTLSDDQVENHPGKLELTTHKPITIKYNYDVGNSITNAAEAIVHSWDGYEQNGKNYLNVLYVQLLGRGSLKKFHPELPTGVVPLTPITRSFKLKYKTSSLIVSRTQVAAILNFSITDYGSQGKDKPWNIFSVTDCSDHFHFYVMASRSTHHLQTAIIGEINWDIITSQPNIEYIKFLMVMEVLDFATSYCLLNPDDTLFSNCNTDDDILNVSTFSNYSPIHNLYRHTTEDLELQQYHIKLTQS